MTPEQVKNLAQQTMAALGPLVILLGYSTTDAWGKWSAAVVMVAGAVATIIGVIYGMWTNSQTGLVKAVDALAKDPQSPVAGVIVTQTPEGKELADAIPGKTTVTAGTVDAAKLAQEVH